MHLIHTNSRINSDHRRNTDRKVITTELFPYKYECPYRPGWVLHNHEYYYIFTRVL